MQRLQRIAGGWILAMAALCGALQAGGPRELGATYTYILLGKEYHAAISLAWGSGEWFAFEVDIAGTYAVDVTASSFEKRVVVYGPGEISDQAIVGEEGGERDTFTADEDEEETKGVEEMQLQEGLYYVQVTSINGQTGPFTIKVDTSGREGAVYSIDEDEFSGIPPSVSIEAEISESGESDWYSFTAASTHYAVEIRYTRNEESEMSPAKDLLVYLYEGDQVTRVKEWRWTRIHEGDDETAFAWSYEDWVLWNDLETKEPPHGNTPPLVLDSRYYFKVVGRSGDIGSYTIFVGELQEEPEEKQAPDLHVSRVRLNDRTIGRDGQDILVVYDYGMTGVGSFDTFTSGVFVAGSYADLLSDLSPAIGTTALDTQEGLWPDLITGDGDGAAVSLGDHEIMSLSTEETEEEIAKTASEYVHVDPADIEGVLGDTEGVAPSSFIYLMYFIDELDDAKERDETNNFQVATIRVVEDDEEDVIQDEVLVEILGPSHGDQLTDPETTIWGYVYDRPQSDSAAAPTVTIMLGGTNVTPDEEDVASVEYVSSTAEGLRKWRFYRDTILGNGNITIAVQAQDAQRNIANDEISVIVSDAAAREYWSAAFFENRTRMRLLNIADSELGVGIHLSSSLQDRSTTVAAGKVLNTTLEALGFTPQEAVSMGGMTLAVSGQGRDYLRGDAYIKASKETYWVPIRSGDDAAGDTGAVWAHDNRNGISTVLFIYNYLSYSVSPEVEFRNIAGESRTYDLGAVAPRGWLEVGTGQFPDLDGSYGSFSLINAPVASAALLAGEVPLEVRVQNTARTSGRTLTCPFFSTLTSGKRQENTLISLYNPALRETTASFVFSTGIPGGYSYSIGPKQTLVLDLLGMGVPGDYQGGFKVVANGNLVGDAWLVNRNTDDGTFMPEASNLWLPMHASLDNRIAYFQSYTRSAAAVTGTASSQSLTDYDTTIAFFNTGMEAAFPRILFHRNDAKVDVTYNVTQIPAGSTRQITLKTHVSPVLYGTPNENMEGWLEILDADDCAVGVWIIDEVTDRDYVCPMHRSR